MPDEITISDSSTGAPRFRATEEGDNTVIRDYATNAPRFVLDGKIGGGGVTVMTTVERIAITPEAGQLIFDCGLNQLFVGDGTTVGGVEVSGGGIPSILSLGDWTDEMEDVYEIGDWTR